MLLRYLNRVYDVLIYSLLKRDYILNNIMQLYKRYALRSIKRNRI